MNRIPILDVKKIDALAKDLSFMIGFNSQTLSCAQPSQTLFQNREELIFARRFLRSGFHLVDLRDFTFHGSGLGQILPVAWFWLRCLLNSKPWLAGTADGRSLQ